MQVRRFIYIYIYSPICPLYIYSPLYEQPPICTPLTGLGQWHEQQDNSQLFIQLVVELSYDRRILRSATTMKDHQGFVPRPSHDRRTTNDD